MKLPNDAIPKLSDVTKPDGLNGSTYEQSNGSTPELSNTITPELSDEASPKQPDRYADSRIIQNCIPALTSEYVQLTEELEAARSEFLNLFTLHKNLVENDTSVLSSLYLDRIGRFELELLQKETEVKRLAMKVKFIYAALNRNEQPDLVAIEIELDTRFNEYYRQIRENAAEIENAQEILSSMLSKEETIKLKEVFRLLCKRLHPDLNPNQSETEKDMFIKAKAAYELSLLAELQKILIYIDNLNENEPKLDFDDKVRMIAQLKEQIDQLKQKIDKILSSFPFNMEEQIRDDEYVLQRQEVLKEKIKSADAQIKDFNFIISLITDE